MPYRLQVLGLTLFIALTSCGEKKTPPDSLSIEVPKDSRSGFGDFLAGLGYLTEKEPLKLDIHRDGKRFEVTVYSLRHDSGPIEPLAMILTKEGAIIGGNASPGESENTQGMKDCGELLAMFATGCRDADVEPIVLLSSSPGVSLEKGIELLEFMVGKGVSHIVVADDRYTGPNPEKSSNKPASPSSHPKTPPQSDPPGPPVVNPVRPSAE